MNTNMRPTISATTVAAASVVLLFAPGVRAVGFASLASNPLPARIGDFALKVEPGVALPLSSPQSRNFDTGGGETIQALWMANDAMDVGASASFLTLPSAASGGQPGTAWSLGGTLRFRRPRVATRTFAAASPWAEVDVLYVRTGGLNRPGFAAAAGIALPVGEARVFWIGPFLRYFQIVERERAGFDSTDAKIVSLGLSLEVGLGAERARAIATATRIDDPPAETLFCPVPARDVATRGSK